MKKRIKEEPPAHYQAVEAIKSKKAHDYRPSPDKATLSEAKAILRARYEKLGFEVSSIRRMDEWFSVNFKGNGPSNMESILCNWPYRDGVKTKEAAQKVLHKSVDRILKENKKK